MLPKKNPDTKRTPLYDSTTERNQNSGHLWGQVGWELSVKGHEGIFWG